MTARGVDGSCYVRTDPLGRQPVLCHRVSHDEFEEARKERGDVAAQRPSSRTTRSPTLCDWPSRPPRTPVPVVEPDGRRVAPAPPAARHPRRRRDGRDRRRGGDGADARVGDSARRDAPFARRPPAVARPPEPQDQTCARRVERRPDPETVPKAETVRAPASVHRGARRARVGVRGVVGGVGGSVGISAGGGAIRGVGGARRWRPVGVLFSGGVSSLAISRV